MIDWFWIKLCDKFARFYKRIKKKKKVLPKTGILRELRN